LIENNESKAMRTGEVPTVNYYAHTAEGPDGKPFPENAGCRLLSPRGGEGGRRPEEVRFGDRTRNNISSVNS
jgi:hypothetical protein